MSEVNRVNVLNLSPASANNNLTVLESQLQLLKNSLLEDPLQCSEPVLTVPRTWEMRQEMAAEKWESARPELLDLMLSANKTPQCFETCQQCNMQQAVIRCRDCLPKELFCSNCDVSIHQNFVLHNRDSVLEGFFKPIPPTCFVSTTNVICEQGKNQIF